MYQEKGEYHKVFGAIIMMVSTVFSLGFFLVLLVFGLRGWIAKSLVSDQLAVQLLLLLIFLTPDTGIGQPPGRDARHFLKTKLNFFSKIRSWTRFENFVVVSADLIPK